MDQYEVEPVRIPQSADSRRVAISVAVVVLLLAAVILKPWEGAASGGPLGQAVPVADAGSPHPSATTAASPRPTPTDASIRPWPARTIRPSASAGPTQGTQLLIAGLATHAGTWGVGTAGIGPRILREEPWTDWVAVAPEAFQHALTRMGTWPDTEACSDAPAVFDRPSIIGIGVPSAIPSTWKLGGWWTDGTHVVDLGGSLRDVSPAASEGIGYFERIDGAPWPAGRYEFHVMLNDGTFVLTVCLTRRG
jgi:hypothetical protein